MFDTCFSTAPSVTTSRSAIAAFERPSAISERTSRSRGVRSSRRESRRPPSSCATASGSSAVTALGDPPDRLDEVAHVGHAVLEEIAHAAAAVGEQLRRERLLHVLREDEHR